MISIMKQSGKDTVYLKELVADTLQDVANLPTDIAAGSTTICVENGEVYILGGDKQWHIFQ